MNFKGHFTGGLIAAAATTTVAVMTVGAELNLESVTMLWEQPFKENPIQIPVFVFATTVFMSLFPDLDTASIIQRWCYRFLFFLLLILMINKQYDYFSVLAFVSVLPLIDKHRGWTHWKITPWLIVFFLSIVFEYIRAKNTWFSHFKWDNTFDFLLHYWIYIFAAVIGHYTHLFLDTPKAKKIGFIKWMDK